jgi:hypothetical protein
VAVIILAHFFAPPGYVWTHNTISDNDLDARRGSAAGHKSDRRRWRIGERAGDNSRSIVAFPGVRIVSSRRSTVSSCGL